MADSGQPWAGKPGQQDLEFYFTVHWKQLGEDTAGAANVSSEDVARCAAGSLMELYV